MSLHRFPAGELELALIAERREQIRLARKTASIEVRDNRKFKVLHLPDAFDDMLEPQRHEVRYHIRGRTWR